MEELYKTIEELLNPKQNYPNEIKVETQGYLEKIICEHASDCNYFFSLLNVGTGMYVKFWAVGALEQIILKYYNSYTKQMKDQFHDLYFNLLLNEPSVVLCNPHVESKYALLFILLVRSDYPTQWPDAFTRLMILLKQQSLSSQLRYTSTLIFAIFFRFYIEYACGI